jgi:hypothetical protein
VYGDANTHDMNVVATGNVGIVKAAAAVQATNATAVHEQACGIDRSPRPAARPEEPNERQLKEQWDDDERAIGDDHECRRHGKVQERQAAFDGTAQVSRRVAVEDRSERD